MTPRKESLAPWSISKGKVAHNCTLRFNLKYVEKAEKQKVEASAGRIGAAAHVFVEECLKGVDYKKAYKKAVMSQVLTREETLELATFKNASLDFVDRFTKWRENMGVSESDFFIEKEVAFDRNKNESEYWGDNTFFRGKWDVGAIVRQNNRMYVVILDHKSGQPKEDLGRYRNQLWSYIASAYVMFPQMAGAQTAIHWMKEEDRSNAIAWGPMVSADNIEEKVMPWFWDYFEEAEEKGVSDPVPSEGWYCDYCEYKYRCPLFKE